MLGPLQAEAQFPHSMEGMSLPPEAKGDFYFSQGKFKESLSIYKSIQEGGADSSYIFRKMVQAWKSIEALDEAEKYLNTYRQDHQSSSSVLYALGYLYYLKDDGPKAEKLFKRATELDSKNGLAWNNWAASLADDKHFEEALEKVKIAIQTNPKELMFYANVREIYKLMGRAHRFEEDYKEFIRKGDMTMAWGYGKTLVRSMRQKAFAEYANDNKLGAVSGFEQILKIYQQINDVMGQVPALFSLGVLYEELGQAQKGQEFFNQVLAINPDHIQAREKVKPIN